MIQQIHLLLIIHLVLFLGNTESKERLSDVEMRSLQSWLAKNTDREFVSRCRGRELASIISEVWDLGPSRIFLLAK